MVCLPSSQVSVVGGGGGVGAGVVVVVVVVVVATVVAFAAIVAGGLSLLWLGNLAMPVASCTRAWCTANGCHK